MRSDAQQYLFDNFVFVSGVLTEDGGVGFVAHYGPALRDDLYITQLMSWKPGHNWAMGSRVQWQTVDLTYEPSTSTYTVLGRDGEISTFTSGTTNDDQIAAPGLVVGPMQGIRTVGGDVLAYGLQRQVFRRTASGWTPLTDGFLNPDPGPDASASDRAAAIMKNSGGIKGMGGDSLADLYGVGSRGEIWRFDGNLWTSVASPTNVTLNDITLASDGTMYACGDRGVLLKGQQDRWQLVEYEGRNNRNLLSMVSFQQRLYFADGQRLCCLLEGEMVPVEVTLEGKKGEVSAHRVVTDGESLVSIAGKEIYLTRDGESWEPILH